MTVSLQARLYTDKLRYKETVKIDKLSPEQAKGVVNAIVGLINSDSPAAPGHMRMNLCNIMIREEGKLVSYRKFTKA